MSSSIYFLFSNGGTRELSDFLFVAGGSAVILNLLAGGTKNQQTKAFSRLTAYKANTKLSHGNSGNSLMQYTND